MELTPWGFGRKYHSRLIGRQVKNIIRVRATKDATVKPVKMYSAIWYGLLIFLRKWKNVVRKAPLMSQMMVK